MVSSIACVPLRCIACAAFRCVALRRVVLRCADMVLASFVPRKTPRSNRDDEGVVQAGDAELGWRLYVRPSLSSGNDPVVLYCHANAENVADVEQLAPVLHSAGAAAVFAFDYRGYGFSTGTPTMGTLLTDVEHVVAALPGILARFALSGRPLVAYGRSLGAACAVHVASTMPVRWPGCVSPSSHKTLAREVKQLLLHRALLCTPSGGMPDHELC